MNNYAQLWIPTRLDLRRLIKQALKHPFNGQQIVNDRHRILASSITEPGRPTSILVTLDVGTHASGWWRNSDYDRCLHLSLAHPPMRPVLLGTVPRVETPTDKEVAAWAEALFGPHLHKTWTEPAASVFDPYRRPNVPHVRLFLDRNNQPIKPEGEVYHLKPWADGSSPEKIFR